MQVCTVRMRMLEHVCAGVCRDADVRSYHLEQGTRNHSEVITVIFLSRGTRFANGEDGVDKNVVWGYFATQRQLLIRASQGEIIGWLNDRSVGDDERKGQFVLTSLLFTSSVNFTWRFLLLVSNLCEMCATHTLTFVCILVCVCVCVWLVTLEPVVLSSDPDPRHLSAQITHTDTQLLWPFPGAEIQSQLPAIQNLPAQQGCVFLFF